VSKWIYYFILKLSQLFAISDSYSLEVGQNASARLDYQHVLLKRDSENHLLEAGLKEGMTVLDIGCGNGVMTLWIASKVGQNGRVIAIDSSPQHIALAKERANANGVSNIEFICGDIQEFNLPLNSLDFIYCRFLLMHLQNPLSVIQKAYFLLKDEGIFAAQEPINSALDLYPHQTDLIKELQSYFKKLSEKFGVDFDLGSNLYSLFYRAGYPSIHLHFSQRATNLSQMKGLLLRFLNDTEPKALNTGVTSKESLTRLRNSIEAVAEGNGAFFIAPRQAHIIAYKTRME
jgi:ubiquinone/menaquinone biosynthesis C-methylase UbiE